MTRPIVALVGRPNVGKSTLFNRLAGERLAVVDEMPGTTRDRIVAEAEWNGIAFDIVDTGGLDPAAGRLRATPATDPATYLEEIRHQAEAACREADAILLIVDVIDGVTAADADVAQFLRRQRRQGRQARVLLVVNKCDTPKHESRAAEFHRLGFARVRAISAEHGRGAWDVLEEIVAELPTQVVEEGTTDPDSDHPDAIRVAVVGRPNVGKSSLVNRLLGAERMVVSDEGGTTRDAIDSVLERRDGVYVLVDTAGLRRQGRRDRIGERTSALMAVRSLERADVALVVTDAADGFTDQDATVLGLARDSGCATAVLLNKWDLVHQRGASERAREAVLERLRFAADTPILAIAAKTGLRVDKVLPLVRKLAKAARRRISTAELNRWLKDATDAHEPAMAQRGTRKRPLRLLYATQVGVRPPSIVIFCSDPAGVKESYLRYLENRLRERFDLGGTPLRIQLRSRREKKGAR